MRVIFETRFSFQGKSGWRSLASRDAALLFDPDRLEKRFTLYENITLPSLANQTDNDFNLVVLASARMPDKFRTRLQAVTEARLGPGRCFIKFARPGYAGKKMGAIISSRYKDESRIAEVVLDDDDAISNTFVSDLKTAVAQNSDRLDQDPGYCFFSFPSGVSLSASDGRIRLTRRHVPFTNLGLTLVSKPGTRPSVFSVAHLRIGDRHPHVVIESGAIDYVRTLHGQNDSRAFGGNMSLTAQEIETQVHARFPQLASVRPEWLA